MRGGQLKYSFSETVFVFSDDGELEDVFHPLIVSTLE